MTGGVKRLTDVKRLTHLSRKVQVDVAKIASAIGMSKQSMQSVSGTFNVCSVAEKKIEKLQKNT